MATAPDPDRWFHIGPHGFFDLVRLARRGRTTLVRVLYLLALFAVLYAVHERSSDDRTFRRVRGGGYAGAINHNARIAERFSYTILIAQCVAVMLLTPIYIAASVHEERDNRALGILFSTQLTARAILQGKLLARVVQVGSVVLAGLPLLALVQLWGGIDMPIIVANFWNTGLWLISVGTFSLMIATYTSTMIRAVLLTYAFLACTLCCFCVPDPDASGLIFLLRPQTNAADSYMAMLNLMVILTIMHLGFAVCCFLYRAVINLEAHRSDERIPIKQEANEFDDLPNRFWLLPEMGDDVIAWKERFLYRGISHIIPIFFMPLLLIFVFGLTVDWLERRSMFDGERDAPPGLIILFKLVALASFGLFTLLVTIGATGCIVGERQRQTLDALLLLPIERRELLRAKLRGNVWRYWPWLAIAATYWFCMMLFGGYPFLTGVVLLATGLIHLTFFATLGIYLSVFCRTSLSAYTALAIVFFLLLAGPHLATWLFNPTEFSEDFLRALSPVRCWMDINADWHFRGATSWSNKFGAKLYCLWIYLVASFALWRVACRRFANRAS